MTNGLPPGETGKIGLAIYRRDPRILMAIVEREFQPNNDDPAYDLAPSRYPDSAVPDPSPWPRAL